MDRYNVELSANAAQDVREIYGYIREHGPADPDLWKQGLDSKLTGLEVIPEACPLAPENDYRSGTLRETYYGPFRIIFEVRSSLVAVLTIRHSARRLMTRRQLQDLE